MNMEHAFTQTIKDVLQSVSASGRMKFIELSLLLQY